MVLGIDSSGFRVHESLILLFLGTVLLLFLGTELLLVLGTVGFGSTRRDWLGLGSWIQWRRLSCNGEVTIIIIIIIIIIRGLSKERFHKMINLIVKDNYFLFNGKLRKQIDGLAMGNPISVTFANIFMSHHEKQWLANCPREFKPIIYRRYVDDTFMIFEKEEQINLFYEYLNKQHQKIRFTMEKEENNKLPFLDLLLERNNSDQLDISIYRKPTYIYTGLGTNFLSACFEKYKINTITTLQHRAFNLTSTYALFHAEIEILKSFF